ncbi:MAG: hypothetical protein FWE71_05100 [Nocardioidaceae bacterium]|nr:hypothetical protein [Nocardioidaceae bacterium]MCL2613314.1 hypothetical protein [Nocardioidaceae bacterium]
MTAVLGWVVGLLDVVQFMPQLGRVVRIRHDHAAVSDLSVWTWTIATIQGAAWVVYGFAEGLLPIAVPNVVITPVCATLLAFRLRAARRAHRSAPAAPAPSSPPC